MPSSTHPSRRREQGARTRDRVLEVATDLMARHGYSGPEPATLISGDGGTNAAWSPDGRQIYYRQPSGPGVLMAVDVTPGDEFQAGRPALLIDPWTSNYGPVRAYDVFPDGSFVTVVRDQDISQAGGDGGSILSRRLEQFGATELHVVLNFFEELKARVPN